MKYILIILVICLAAFLIWQQFFNRDAQLKKQAKEIILKAEQYKSVHGFYPTSLPDIGMEEKQEDPLFYERRDSLNYIIWYGLGLGDSEVYSSKTGKWGRNQYY